MRRHLDVLRHRPGAGHAADPVAGEVRAGESGDDTLRRPGGVEIHAVDAGVRVRAADDRHVDGAGQRQVVDEGSAPAQQRCVLLALDGRPDVGLGGLGDGHDATPAADATAFTMLWYPVQRQRFPSSPVADRGLIGRGAAVDQADRGEHHARRAVAALERVLVVERLLDGMQLPVLREALDRGDLGAVGLDTEHRARLHRLAVHEHGAGPARGGVAADVGTGESEPLAKDEDQEIPRFDLELVPYAVRVERDSSHRPSFRRRQTSSVIRERPFCQRASSDAA